MGCFWVRIRGSSGKGLRVKDIIAMDRPVGPAVVTIEPTDMAFMTEGCGSWQLVPPIEHRRPVTPFASFVERLLPLTHDIAELTARSEEEFALLAWDKSDVLRAYLLSAVPDPCYLDAYAAAWRLTDELALMARLGGSPRPAEPTAPAEPEAIAALRDVELLARATTALTDAISATTCATEEP